MATMTAQKLRQKIFVDGDLAIAQGGQFLLIIVHQDDVMSQVGKTSARHQSYVS